MSEIVCESQVRFAVAYEYHKRRVVCEWVSFDQRERSRQRGYTHGEQLAVCASHSHSHDARDRYHLQKRSVELPSAPKCPKKLRERITHRTEDDGVRAREVKKATLMRKRQRE